MLPGGEDREDPEGSLKPDPEDGGGSGGGGCCCGGAGRPREAAAIAAADTASCLLRHSQLYAM
jgi:hypothetical protein